MALGRRRRRARPGVGQSAGSGRHVTDEFIIAVRNLNRLTVLAQDENPPENAREMIDQVVQRMRTLVDRIVAAAGQSDSSRGGDAERAAD